MYVHNLSENVVVDDMVNLVSRIQSFQCSNSGYCVGMLPILKVEHFFLGLIVRT